MAQQNEHNHSFDPATAPVKRKRGRPRKEDVPGTEPSGRTRRRRRNPPPTAGPGLVGQQVSGILDGVFDAGFLITVRVGNSGPLFRGMVFDSRLSVPISAANDVAPHIMMSKREEIPIPAPIPAKPLQRRGPYVPSPLANKGGPKDGSQGSALKSRVSDAVISGAHSTIAKEATPVTVQVSDDQRQGLSGESKLDSTSKASQGNETAGVKQTTPINEATDELKVDCVKQTTPGNEPAGEPMVVCVSQTTLGNETVGEPKVDCVSQTPVDNETASELKQCCTDQTSPANETASEQKLGCTSHITPAGETVKEPIIESTGQFSPKPYCPAPVSEPDSPRMQKFRMC